MPYRWFFSFGLDRNRADVDRIKALVDTAAAHGLNGMVLSSFDLDAVSRWKESDVALLKELSDHCAKKGVELIPTGFSVGYGGAALAYDRSFAAALPAVIRLKVAGGRMVPAPSSNLLKNGGLEEHNGDRFPGYGFHDRPGEVSLADSQAASGRTSIRFENFGQFEHGHGRINQEVAVKPGHAYRLKLKLKTQDLVPVSGLKLMVYANGRSLADVAPDVKPTQDWTEIVLDYVNQDQQQVLVYAGIWEGKSGRFWLDDLSFSEFGDLTDIVRRDGAPLRLRSLDRNLTFEEGRDFEAIRCLHWQDSVRVPAGSALRDGENLELACYKIPFVLHPWGKQISLCMSNPKLYEYWEGEARRLHEILPFKKFLLSMDEIRNGGGCLSCRGRGLSMAQILGDCVTRQRALLKRIDPGIEVMIWSDMLDPAHNAHDHYYGVVGDFTGSAKYVPKDLTIVCWHRAIRDTSLSFFSREGFRTLGAAYYDAADLAGCREWAESLAKTPQACGILYTTWERKYELLAPFGELVKPRGAP